MVDVCSTGSPPCSAAQERPIAIPGRRVSSFHPTFPKPKKELDVASHFFSSPSIAHAWRFFAFVSYASLLDDVQCLAGDGCRHLTGGFSDSPRTSPTVRKKNWAPGAVHHQPPIESPFTRRKVASTARRVGVSVPPEGRNASSQKNVFEGIEAALGALATVGTVDGPKVQMPRPSVQFRSVRSPNRSAHGVWRGQEAIDSARCIPPAACCRCPGERSSSRTLPCLRCHCRVCASTSRVSRVRESSSVPPANGEPTPTHSRVQGRHCGTSEGQTETFSIRRHNPSHAHSFQAIPATGCRITTQTCRTR